MNPLLEPLETLLREAKARHALDGPCSHPACCPMACAIAGAESALTDFNFTALVPPLSEAPELHVKN